MTIEPAKFRVIHQNRSFASQRAIRRAMREILADATNRGCDADTINAMEAVLRNLRLVYSRDSGPAYEPNMTMDAYAILGRSHQPATKAG